MGTLLLLVMLLLGSSCIEAKTYTPLPPPDPKIPTVPQPRLPQNDAYEGSTVLRRLQPRFVWEAATVAEGELSHYELQYSADRTFSAGVLAARTIQASYQPDVALAVSTAPPVGQRYFWRVRACAGDVCSEYSPPWWVNVGRSSKDFNGDGYDDVIVSSHISLDDAALPGRAFVYFGSPGNVFNTSVEATLRDFAMESWFGYSVASAGDFNGDGFADVLVGAPKSDNVATDAGRAYLYLGGPGAVFDATADVVFEGRSMSSWLGGSVSGAGDVNADGYSDVIIGALDESGNAGAGRAYLYFGSKQPSPIAQSSGALSGSASSLSYAASVTSAGDINGDGFADVIVNSSSYLQYDPAEICTSDIFLGGDGVQFDSVKDGQVSGSPGEKCNFKTAGAGDVNGDGFSDVIARVNFRAQGARLFLGGKELPNAPDVVLNLQAGHQCREAFGVGDVNGDGADDIAFSDYVSTASGQVYVHFGKPGAKRGALATDPAAVLSKSSSYTLFGWVVRPAGDVNGDGLEDIILGDQGENEAAGSFYVYFGNGGGTLDNLPDGIVTGSGPRTYIGYSVAMSFPSEEQRRIRRRRL